MKSLNLLFILVLLSCLACRKEEQPAPIEPKPKELTSESTISISGYYSPSLLSGLGGDNCYDAGDCVCIISDGLIQWVNKQSLEVTKALDLKPHTIRIYTGRQDTIICADLTFYRLKPFAQQLEKIGVINNYPKDFSVIPGKGIIYYVQYDQINNDNYSVHFLDFNGNHQPGLFQLDELKNDSITLMDLEAYEENNEFYLVYYYSHAFQLSKMKTVNISQGKTIFEKDFPANTSLQFFPAIKPHQIRSLTSHSGTGKKFAVTDIRNGIDVNEWNFRPEVAYDLTESQLFFYEPNSDEARLYTWQGYQPQLEIRVPLNQKYPVSVNIFKDWLGMIDTHAEEVFLIDYAGEPKYKLKSAGYYLLYADQKIALVQATDKNIKVFRLE